MDAADEHILNAGTAYLQIQMASFLFFTLTSVITAVLRGIGDSKTAMYYNSIANLVNIILNYLLIGGKMGFPRLEVAGASYATAISQIVACFLAFFAIAKKSCYLHISLKDSFSPVSEDIREIMHIGLPAALEQFMMRVGSMIFSKQLPRLALWTSQPHQICMNIPVAYPDERTGVFHLCHITYGTKSRQTASGHGASLHKPLSACRYDCRNYAWNQLYTVWATTVFPLYK